MKERQRHAWFYFPVLAAACLLNSFSVAGSELHRVAFPIFAAGLGLYMVYLLSISTVPQRMLFLVGMLVCAFGENFLVYALDLYHFAPTATAPYAIPPYVIVGHGYTLWFVAVLVETIDARFDTRVAARVLFALGMSVFAARLVLTRDVFGGLWIVFLVGAYLGTPDADARLFSATTFLVGVALELVGVRLDAWHWHASPYFLDTGRFPIADPPAAVGAFYVGGEVVTFLLMRRFGLAPTPSKRSRLS